MAAKKKVSRKSASSSPSAKATSVPHGGRIYAGRRKAARVLSENALTHVVLTSSAARGKLAFSIAGNRKMIDEVLSERSDQFGVHLSELRVHGKDLHLFLTFNDRDKFKGFLRIAPALIARRLTGARKGKPFGRKFWDHIAFTRTINPQNENPADAIKSFNAEFGS